MVRVTDDLALSPEALALYHTADPLLGHLPVLAFHGPSTTANFTHNSSRIQVHVYSPAGFQSFPRLTISPQSDLYGAVAHLPREFQGDDVCRGLAFALFKYFCELPDAVKVYLRREYPTTRGRRPGSAPTLFGAQHAADLAQAMVGVEPGVTEHVIETLTAGALQTQHVSNIDLDLVLPPGAISQPRDDDDFSDLADLDDDDAAILDPTLRQYDPTYTPLVKLFGEPVFLPTAKLRRAPSRPSSTKASRSKTLSRDSKVELRMQMGELVDTEERYILKLNELVRHVAEGFRGKEEDDGDNHGDSFARAHADLQPAIAKLFPPSIDRILQVNTAFLQELRRVMDDSEEDALRDLDGGGAASAVGSASSRTMLAGATATAAAARKDPSGALAMAKTFLEWFPRFTECYQDYIRASQHFPQLLNTLLDASASASCAAFRDRVVQTTGEQVLRSILIEPVQRLPRYSLFIDQIVGCLPITHPALQPMLKARDIVTNICSMDDPLDEEEEGGDGRQARTVNRLRNLVGNWPVDLEPRGRLILAADVVELAPPYIYDGDVGADAAAAGLFLLFNDCLVLAKKTGSASHGTAPTGRDLLREIDKPSAAGLLASMTNAAGGPGTYDFVFDAWHVLADVRFTESTDGRCIWLTGVGGENSSRKKGSRCFALQEGLEGKAGRWSEDVTKARIEGRFSERERETATWTLRSVRLPETSSDGSFRTLGLHAAVFQEAAEQLIEGRREPAPVRIVFDNHLGTKGAPVGHYGVEVVVEVRTVGGSRLIMNTAGLNDKKYSDDIAVEDFLPTLARRITQLTSVQHNTANPRLIPALVAYHSKALRALEFEPKAVTSTVDMVAVTGSSSRAEKTRSFLASSPVKLLSSFLGSGSSTSNVGSTGAAGGASASSTNLLADSIYGSMRRQRSKSSSGRATLSQQTLQQAFLAPGGGAGGAGGVGGGAASEVSSLNGSIRGRSIGAGGSIYNNYPSQDHINGSTDGPVPVAVAVPENPLVRLEQTFTCYVALLQSRRGQFFARTLLNRQASSAADELSVNVLYNRMNESPFDWDEAATELPADVVFAAFEKFTSIAWRDHMGTIMTIQALDALQERAAVQGRKKVPGDFADFVRFLFADMAPQNRRAFAALVKLLADLLQGCSDDGDRGALTLAFAELLVAGSGEPAHNYINLFDRLVDDCDHIFDQRGVGIPGIPAGLGPGFPPAASPARSYEPSLRTHASATASITSNTSSLRRKFGLEGLLRQNSAAGDPAGIDGGGSGGGDRDRDYRDRDKDKEKSSMWRSLSKHRHPATGDAPASMSKATAAYINRSRSIDMGNPSPGGGGGGFAAYAGGSGAFSTKNRRPGSRDRPPVAGAFLCPDDGSGSGGGGGGGGASSAASSRPGSSHRPTSSHKQLETIGEPADDRHEGVATGGGSKRDGAARKKRRSSLSDLKSLMAAATLEGGKTTATNNSGGNRNDASLQPRPLQPTKPTPTTPSTPSKIPVSPPGQVLGHSLSYSHAHSHSHPDSHARSPAAGMPTTHTHTHTHTHTRHQSLLGTPRGRDISDAAVGGPSYIPLKSARPTRLPPPSTPGRPASGSVSSTTGTTGGGRLRLQSPQKLRERLQSEKRAVEEVDASLRTELSRITQDMARMTGAGGNTADPTHDSLAAALQSLEQAVPRRIQEVLDRQASLERAMEASVRASEAKVRGIDQLYKEATAENELLYEKFNVELAKIVRALKGKGREDKEELVARLREQSEETARLKRENARLQREAVSLRALLKEQ